MPQQQADGTTTTPATALNLDGQSIGGETPLMKAAEAGSMEICIALLRAGCNPFITDNQGKDAAFYAKLQHPLTQIAEMLMAYMDDINQGMGGGGNQKDAAMTQ